MTLIWLTLLLFHQGSFTCCFSTNVDTLVPVVTVELGQSLNLTCSFSTKYQSDTWFYWYKQTAGDTLNLIAMQQRSITAQYGPEFSASRFNLTSTEDGSNLTIFRTLQQDEGMYHCAQWNTLKYTWSGSYLSIKGNSKMTSSYTVFHQPTLDSETLQCSVLSDFENTTCSGEPSLFWFRARSTKSFPDTIYTGGKRSENCEERSDSQNKCFYNFSKNISSTDAGTYYCAVATCGQILFAENHKNGKTNEINMLVITIVAIICLVISLIGNIVFICFRTQSSACQQFKESLSSQKRNNFIQKGNDTDDGPDMNYAALHFSEGRTSREKKKKREFMTEESVYSQVKGSV